MTLLKVAQLFVGSDHRFDQLHKAPSKKPQPAKTNIITAAGIRTVVRNRWNSNVVQFCTSTTLSVAASPQTTTRRSLDRKTLNDDGFDSVINHSYAVGFQMVLKLEGLAVVAGRNSPRDVLVIACFIVSISFLSVKLVSRIQTKELLTSLPEFWKVKSIALRSLCGIINGLFVDQAIALQFH